MLVFRWYIYIYLSGKTVTNVTNVTMLAAQQFLALQHRYKKAKTVTKSLIRGEG